MKFSGLFEKGVARWFVVDKMSLPSSRRYIAGILYVYGRILLLLNNRCRAYDLMMTSQRIYPCSFYADAVVKSLPSIVKYYPEMMADDVKASVTASRSIIVKMPARKAGAISKGIIFITFTDTFRYYFHHVDNEELLKYFHVVLEPSWAGYCLPEILFWCTYENPVIVQATEVLDRDLIDRLNNNLIQIETGASDWVNYRKYDVKSSGITYDSIYVANYNPVKRLHVYFKALSIIKKRGVSYKGAIVCARWGGQREVALKLIELYDIADVLDIHESLKAVEINDVLNRSKCNLLLSLKEGSNRSMFEAMFTDTPVIMLKENIGVNKDYINSSTGLIVEERNLVDALLDMQSGYESYTARPWAMDNISPEETTKKIVNKIKSVDKEFFADASGVKVKTNEPEVHYFNEKATLDKIHYMEEVLSIFDRDDKRCDIESAVLELSDEFNRAC